jgi:hypothetical protein
MPAVPNRVTYKYIVALAIIAAVVPAGNEVRSKLK